MAADNQQNPPLPPMPGFSARFDMTIACEHGLRAASGLLWQGLGLLAGGQASELGADYFAPARQIIAEYLRRTGRHDEAMEIEAIGCNQPPPQTGFGALTQTERATLRDALRG